MKPFDFDKIIPRQGTNSYKWDEPNDADVLPMWVADMDFPTAPCIINALRSVSSMAFLAILSYPTAIIRR